MTDAEVIALLGQVYTPTGVALWMKSRNACLDGAKPIDLLHTGRRDDVTDLVDTLASGNYA